MTSTRIHRNAALALALAGLASAVAISMSPQRSQPLHLNSMRTDLDTSAAKIVTMGYRTTVASVTWVRVVFDFVDLQFEHSTSRRLEGGLATVVALDPAWRVPYEFAGLVLEDDGGAPSETAIALLRRGCERFPEDWRLRVYLGMGLLGRGDTAQGKKELAKLATIPGEVPGYVRELGISSVRRIASDKESVSNILMAMQIARNPLTNLGLTRKLAELLEHRGVVGSADSAREIEAALRGSDEAAKSRWIRWLDLKTSTDAP